MQRSLGTQLRHLIDLLDGAVERSYTRLGLTYRARYTPVMRCLIAQEPTSLGEIARQAGITQPAATQTVSLMIRDGLVETASSQDGRQKLLRLSGQGRAMVPQLEQAWAATAWAAESLDSDLPVPLSTTLAAAIAALEAVSFDERIRQAGAEHLAQGDKT